MAMKKVCFLSFLLFLTLTWFVSHAQESYSEGQSTLTFDPPTGKYIIRYPSEKGGMINVMYELPNKVLPKVKPVVTFNPATNRFVYTYSVANESSAKQPIMSVDIQGAKRIVPLLEHAEPNGWHFLKHIPIDDPFYAWLGRSDKHVLIYPGDSVSGFSLISHGLPGIILAQFVGRPIDPSNQNLTFPEEPPQEVQDLLYKLNLKPENRYVEVKTVGPDVLPGNLTHEQLLDRLIQLTQEAFQLGWINDQVIANDLGEKLKGIKEKVQTGQATVAANILHAFIHDLEAQHREGEEVTQANKDKHINDNAFYLLKPNAEFILWKLGAK